MANPPDATTMLTPGSALGEDLTNSAREDTTKVIEALLTLGRAGRDLGDFSGAAEHFDKALGLARESGDTHTEADVLNLKAGLSSTLGEHQQALGQLEQALKLVQDEGAENRRANILNNLGTLHTLLGNYPQALESLKTAHELLRRVAPRTRSMASNLTNLGALYQELGNDMEARAFFIQAIEVAQHANEPLMAAAALNNMANTYMGINDWTAATEYFQQALAISR